MPKRIDALTDAQRAKMEAHADRWIEIGLRTGAANRPEFEAAAKKCYEFAGIPWHNNVVWVSSPLVMAIAAPVAALVIQIHRKQKLHRGAVGDAVRDAVGGAVGGAVRDAVGGAVGGAVRGAVGGAVGGAVRDAVRGAVGDAVRGAVDGAGAVGDAVGDAVGGAVRGAVGDADAVRDAVGDAVGDAVRAVISQAWSYYLGGQFWVGGWYWGGAYTSFFREACGLELQGDLWDRGRAYEATLESACWWYPHRDFLMVVERPLAIHRELVSQERPRGWGSHRLHNPDGAAVLWPDGWGVYAIHGARIPGWIINHPERIGVKDIEGEGNAEVRRIMLEKYGWARYMRDCGARVVDEVDEAHPIRGLRGAKLLRKELPDEPEPIIYLDMVNSSPEPDGTFRRYLERIDPKAYSGVAARSCHAAMASRWRYRDEAGALQMTFADYRDYRPAAET